MFLSVFPCNWFLVSYDYGQRRCLIDMILVFLNLLRLFLCPNMWPTYKMFCMRLKRMYVLLLWGEMLWKYQLNLLVLLVLGPLGRDSSDRCCLWQVLHLLFGAIKQSKVCGCICWACMSVGGTKLCKEPTTDPRARSVKGPRLPEICLCLLNAC